MRFGVAIDLGVGEEPLPARLERAEALLHDAESAGYESVWIGETYSVGPPGMHLPGSLLTLAALAPRTTLKLGTGVLLFPAWHPLKLAYETALLDQISGGRLILGFGLGRPHLHSRFGHGNHPIGDLADDTLGALQALWRGEDGYAGSLLRISGGIVPKSWSPGGIPILVGGSIRRSAERAARYGIGYHASTSYPLPHIEAQVAHVQAAWNRHRPSSPPPVIHANRLTIVAETSEEATALGRRWAGSILRQYNRGGSLHRLGLPDLSSDAIFDRLRDEFCIVGTADEAAEQIRRYSAIGVTHLDLRVAPGGMPAELGARTIHLLREAGVVSASAGAHG